jgi:PTS system nitrogen regulatory IIA component
MKISDYIQSNLIAFLDVETRDEAIDALIDLVSKHGKVKDKESFKKAIYQREALLSTGIGMAVALPHAKLKGLNDFFIAIGIQKKQGLDWNSLDKAPVRLIFLIGGPENKQSEYLQILSLLTSSIRDVEFRKKLLLSTNSEQILELFSHF